MAGRPSNRDERYAQVMQALVRCVARFGLEGASLTQIAAEAGLSRPLIRHHLGNREDMIAALQT
jgi:AcrR family transcriptional regulator